jgi:hypothetical protein
MVKTMTGTPEYPGYDSLCDGDAETVDFPFHGGGRKGIRHKYDIGEGGELVVHVGISRVWDHPSVNVDVAFDGNGPNSHFRINPGRRDMAETVIDGHEAARD